MYEAAKRYALTQKPICQTPWRQSNHSLISKTVHTETNDIGIVYILQTHLTVRTTNAFLKLSPHNQLYINHLYEQFPQSSATRKQKQLP